MRAEVLQLRLHLPLAPSGIPVLYWDQHWNLWFVPHSSDFQHLLTTGLAFGSGHGNPKVTRRLAHKRKNTFAVPSPTNKMPSLMRQSHHKFTISEGTETLLKHFTYVVKEHYPLKRYFYQTISIHQRELYQQKKMSWIVSDHSLDVQESPLRPLLNRIPKGFPSQAGIWYAPGSAVRLVVNPSSSCPGHESPSPSASWPSEACSAAPWTRCSLLSGILCCSG